MSAGRARTAVVERVYVTVAGSTAAGGAPPGTTCAATWEVASTALVEPCTSRAIGRHTPERLLDEVADELNSRHAEGQA